MGRAACTYDTVLSLQQLTKQYNLGRANNTLNRRFRAYYYCGFISP